MIAHAGIIGPLSWLYAARAGLVGPDTTPDRVRLGLLRGLSAPLVLIGSLVLVPLAGTAWAEMSWFLIIPLQLLITRQMRDQARREAGGSSEG